MGGLLARLQNQMAEKEKYDFPDTLEGFGYKFNDAGQLRDIETDKPYEFNVREGDHYYNQKHYNALGDVLNDHIYNIMETSCKLQRCRLPVDAEGLEPQSFVFISGDLYTNKKLLILIHGSGAVRAGQWARRLIINDCLDSGSQLPYIRWARENDYAVLVANTNINMADLPEKKRKSSQVKIRGNSSPEEHTESLWRDIVQRSGAKHIAIVAHSYGGVCTLELAMNHIREFEECVFAIALTDSVHGMRQQEARPEVIDFYKQRAVNWASAYDPLDASLITTPGEVPTVSAGTDRHENTSYSAMNSIFKYFTDRYEELLDPARKRVSIGEPSIIHNSPSLNEQQGLVSRGEAVGQESGEPSGTQHDKTYDKEMNDVSTERGTGDEKITKTGEENVTSGVAGTLEDEDLKNEVATTGTDGESITETKEENQTAEANDLLTGSKKVGDSLESPKVSEANEKGENNATDQTESLTGEEESGKPSGTQHDKTDDKEMNDVSTEQETGDEKITKTGEENVTAGVAGTLEDEDLKNKVATMGTDEESIIETKEENQTAEANDLLTGSKITKTGEENVTAGVAGTLEDEDLKNKVATMGTDGESITETKEENQTAEANDLLTGSKKAEDSLEQPKVSEANEKGENKATDQTESQTGDAVKMEL